MSDVDVLMALGCGIGALAFLGFYFLAENQSKQLRPSDPPIEHFMMGSSKALCLSGMAGLLICALIVIIS